MPRLSARRTVAGEDGACNLRRCPQPQHRGAPTDASTALAATVPCHPLLAIYHLVFLSTSSRVGVGLPLFFLSVFLAIFVVVHATLPVRLNIMSSVSEGSWRWRSVAASRCPAPAAAASPPPLPVFFDPPCEHHVYVVRIIITFVLVSACLGGRCGALVEVVWGRTTARRGGGLPLLLWCLVVGVPQPRRWAWVAVNVSGSRR